MDMCSEHSKSPRKLWSLLNSLTGRVKSHPPPRATLNSLSETFAAIVSDPSRPVHLVQTAETETRCTSEPSQKRRRLCQLSPDGSKSFTKHRLPQSRWSWWYSWPFAKEMCPELDTIPYSNFHCLIRCKRTATGVQTGRHYPCIQVRRSGNSQQLSTNFSPSHREQASWETLRQRSSKFSWPATVFFLKSSLPTAPTTQTEDALAFIVNRLLPERDCGTATGLVFVDLSKAFDRVKHQALIDLLLGIGICDTGLKWFANYLSDRQQRVRVGNRFSSQSELAVVGFHKAVSLALFSSHFLFETCHHVLMLKF